MSTAHKPDVLHAHPTDKTREAFAVLLALPATALTAVAAYVGFDLATTTYVEAEATVVQIAMLGAGLLAVLAWTSVIALHKSARRDLRAGPRRVMVVALLSTFGFPVLAQLVALVAGPAGLGVVFYALMVVAGVTALVAAWRT